MADIVVTVDGVSATVSVGSPLVWGSVDTAQTPEWVALSTSQTPSWQDIGGF